MADDEESTRPRSTTSWQSDTFEISDPDQGVPHESLDKSEETSDEKAINSPASSTGSNEALSNEKVEVHTDRSGDSHESVSQTQSKDQEETDIPSAATIQVSPVIDQVIRPVAITPAPTIMQPPAVPDFKAALPYMESSDLLALKIVGDPQISPDNTSIAFTLQQNDIENDCSTSAIWFVDRSGGKNHPPRQLTTGTFCDKLPRWSPDGSYLAFLSNRAGKNQVYILSLSGGEARQITNFTHGVTEYCWHPSGQMLLAHSPWRPEDDYEQFTDESAKRSASRILSYTHLDEYSDRTQGRYLELWLNPLMGKPTRLTSEPVDLVQSCWSPDGSEIVFSANRRSDADLHPGTALWILTLATGQLRRLTPEEGIARVPVWSPDGKQIAYLFTDDLTESSNIIPWTVNAQGDPHPQPVVSQDHQFTCQSWLIDELHSEWLARPQWYPDSRALLVAAQEKGQVHLYRIDCVTRQVQRLSSGNGRYMSPQLSSNGDTITFVRTDWFTPGDIWCMESNGQNARKLTRVNDAILQSHQLIRPKRITWKSADGLTLEGWLYLPALAGQNSQIRVPLIVMPHGGPTLAWGDSYVHEFQVLAGRGYAVLAPNVRGSAGYGTEFGRKQLNDWGGADYQDLIAGLDYVLQTEPVDEHRLGIEGLSYGGYLTLWTITQTRRFKAAVCRNGVSSLTTASLLSDHAIWHQLAMSDETLQRERSPLHFVQQIKTPLLLLHADQDTRCPFSEARQLFSALRQRKQVVELVRYLQTGHLMDWPGIGSPHQRVDRINRTVTWFDRFI